LFLILLSPFAQDEETMNTSKLAFAAALLAAPAAMFVAAPTVAHAQPIIQQRCTIDSLTPAQATQRTEWARRCGLTLNTGAVPNTGNPNNFFQSTKAADVATGLGANDYRENNLARVFSGNVNDFNINFSHAWSLFGQFFAYTVGRETSGPTLNFFKWSKTTLRTRPLYPHFDSGGTMLFPPPNFDTCTLHRNTTGTDPLPATTPFTVIAYCESSCYTPDQNLRFSTGDVNIVEALDGLRNDLVTLSGNATIEQPSTQVSAVHSYTREIRDAEQIIFKVFTESGGSLSVTNEHPVLVSNGRLVKAESLREGDQLLRANGTPDPIVAIERSTFFGKVYNIRPAATELVRNILIAQGFLVGSARFQNEDIRYMNRALLFHTVPDSVMPR
jgi:hypothetical protein